MKVSDLRSLWSSLPWVRAAAQAADAEPVEQLEADAGGLFRFTAPILFDHLEAKEGEPKKLPTFDIVGYTGVAMNVDAFYYAVCLELSGMKAAAAEVPALLDHNPTQIIGQGAVSIDSAGLRMAGRVTGDDEFSRRVVTHAKNGFKWQASIGAQITRREFLEPGKTAIVNGRQVTGPMVIGRESIVREVSFVALGADGQTSASVAAKHKREGSEMQFAEWLKAKGYDAAKVTGELRSALEAAWKAEVAAGAPVAPAPAPQPAPVAAPSPAPVQAALPVAQPVATTDVLAQVVKAQNDNALRLAEIDRLCGKDHAEIRAQAIKEGWTADATELAVVRAQRAAGPAIHVRTATPSSTQVLEAALCLSQPSIGEQVVLASYGEQVTNQADRYRRLGLRRSIELVAQMSGVELPMAVDAQWIRAAFSTADIAGIVGAVANKALAATVANMNPVAPRITRAASHMNFHTHTVYTLGMTGELQEVAKGGELKHLKLSEENYTRQVKTRGAVLSLDRQDIVNDDLGAFNDNATRIVRKAYVTREKVLFTLVNATGAGSSFFTSAHANYFEGASTNLQLSSITSAVKLFREQLNASSEPTMIEPKLLLVPPALEEVAKALMDRSAQLIAVALGSTSSAKKEPNTNVWAGQFEVVVAPYLGTAFGLSGSSDTAWYLLGAPNDVPAFEIAYLNGQQQPTVDFFGIDTDPNVLGATWRIYWDFGCATAEYRAGVKSKGAA